MLADEAKVRPSHCFHLLAAVHDPAFDPATFAAFARLELRHVEAMLSALQAGGLMPSPKRRARLQGTSQATRLPPAMSMPDDWLTFAQTTRQWEPPVVEGVFQEFLDYWHGVPGQKGVKADWAATWRNWCRRSHTPQGSWQPGADWSPDEQRARIAGHAEFLRKVGRD